MRLTDEQIKATVAIMRMQKGERNRLLSRALAGDADARLVVYTKWRRLMATPHVNEAGQLTGWTDA